MKIKDLFCVEYPSTLIYSEMIKEPAEINFVSSQGDNNGVVSKVKKIAGIKIYPAGVITVPLKGTVLAAHVQVEQCYVAHQIAVLSPLKSMTLQEKLFYCTCIQHNAYRFSYGRQADKTLETIDLPDVLPNWVNDTQISPISTKNKQINRPLDISSWHIFRIKDLFDVKYGINMELTNCTITNRNSDNIVNFVARTENNNGVSAQVEIIDGYEPQQPGLITCAGGGSVLSTFLQDKPFYSGRDLYLLIPKQKISKWAKLFCITIIKTNKYRFNYGRQANSTLPDLPIALPVNKNKEPDWQYMENYIKSLPYGDRL